MTRSQSDQVVHPVDRLIEPVNDQLASALRLLGIQSRTWCVESGAPLEPGWISGTALRHVSGPFAELLGRIGERAGTSDRRTMAALFALRFGWTSGIAILACLRHQVVPDVSLDNISLKFKANTFFERFALHIPRSAAPHPHGRSGPPTEGESSDDAGPMRQCLRRQLVEQAEPVVEALFEWSGFARRGTWGLLTSSWVAHITAHFVDVEDSRAALPVIADMFKATDLAALMQPRMHEVSRGGVVRLFQRRASCCRYYLVPNGDLCASCPLVSDEERLQRNQASMTPRTARPRATGHHA